MAKTSEQFQRFLERLDPDPGAAGDAYERLRSRLIRYFAWETCARPEEWADEVLDRTARRISAGEEVRNLSAFVSGVARLVLLEARRAELREQPLDSILIQGLPNSTEGPEKLASALDDCLAELPPASRDLILKYYEGDAAERIRNRQRLAEQLHLSVNALRNRALRLRDALERCMDTRLRRDGSEGFHTRKRSEEE